MGADAHFYVERKKFEAGGWWPDAQIFVPRCYSLFAYMGDVRGETGWHTPRGLPEDASFTAREDFESDYNHTPSWMTPREYGATLDKVIEDGVELPVEYTAVLEYMLALGDEGDEVRLVFFYDN